MTRRHLLTLLPGTLLAQQTAPMQPPETDWEWNWARFGEVWNPFVENMKQGIFDARLWKLVRERFHNIEGAKVCEGKK